MAGVRPDRLENDSRPGRIFVATAKLFPPPFAGVLTDRVNRHRLLLVTQSLAMLQAFGLSALVWAGHVKIWQLILFNLTLSAINAFDMTARQTFLGEMLDDREDLANAIALNSAMVNGSRLFGPSLAALLIATTGEAGCFFLNGVSFLAVLLALVAMRLPRRPPPGPRRPVLHGLREGLSYIAGHGPIRALLLIVSVVSFAGLPYAVLLPIYARETMGDDPTRYGLLMTAPGVGALVASVVLAWLGLRKAMPRVAGGPVLTGASLIGFAATSSLASNLACLFGAGFGIMFLLNTSNTLLQSLAPDAIRGRVLSFYAMSFLGMSPLGSLVLGGAADMIGIRPVIAIAGVCCLAAGTVFAARMGRWRPAVRAQILGARTLTPPMFPARTELEAREDATAGLAAPQPAVKD
ncbi:MAG TPA: MFS transporter [Gemmataceae bacterium]|nr:MFS transporter [Gemmataceae bacterium]